MSSAPAAKPPRPPSTASRILKSGAIAVRELSRGLLDAVLPQSCLGCNAWIRSFEDRVCGTCRTNINRLVALPACPRCARTMRPESIHDDRCARCERDSRWNVSRLARIGPDDSPLRGMLRALKYAAREPVADFLAGLMAARLRQTTWAATLDLLVPVPMHALRRWQRPCNHAELLARALGRQLRVPVRQAAVRRVKYAPSQTGATTAHERFEQVAGCFGPTRAPGVSGRTVCIVDNLLVTGATIREVSKVLRVAGAMRIYAAVATRSVMSGDFQAAAEALTLDPQTAR